MPSIIPDRRYVFHRKPYSGWIKVRPQAITDKPFGMWYSIGDAWIVYCAQVGLEWNYQFVSEIDVDQSRMLIVSTASAFDAIAQRYGVWEHRKCCAIAWASVAERYAGIEIAPYMHERSATWYLGWDCACGCIWDSSALRSRRVISSGNEAQGICNVKFYHDLLL